MAVGPSEQRALFEARRNLSGLGIETQFTARGDALKGETSPEQGLVVANPLGGPAIEQIVFTVTSDAILRVDQPEPLRGMRGPNAIKVRSVEGIAEALQEAVNRRAAAVRGQAVRLRGLGLEIEIDGERLMMVARVDLEHLGVAILESDGQHLVAHELVNPDQTERNSFDDLAIDIAEFADRVDLELFLSSHAERIAPDREPDALVISGHLAGRDREIPAPEGDVDDEMHALVAGLLPPAVGETWVMHVRIESDDGEEVRYRGVNIAGQAFGAPRVLPKIAFESAYTSGAQGYRMAVQVAEVDDKDVGYVKLDADHRPVGPTRTVSVVGFLANFTAESAAY